MSNAPASKGFVKAMIHNSLRLAAFALGSAVLLVFADNLTKDQIAHQRLESRRQLLNQVLPPSLHDNDLPGAGFQLDPVKTDFSQISLLGLSAPRSGYRANLKGTASGVVLPLETSEGYGGPIVLMIGIAADGSITGVRVVEHSETPGLGSQIDIEQSQWITGFHQHSLADTPAGKWRVKMDGGNFDQFVGATITPRAVVGAVYGALLFFEANKSALLTAADQQGAL